MSRVFATSLILLLEIVGCAAPPSTPLTSAHPASPSADEAPLPKDRSVLDEPRPSSVEGSPTTPEAR